MRPPEDDGDLRNTVTQSGRPRDEERRVALRDAAAGVLLERGLFGTTLQDLAQGVGVSPRMLIHHFGSKDGLLRAALGEARRQQIATARRHLGGATIETLDGLLIAVWSFLTAPDTQAHLRLFGEVAAVAAQHPERFPGFGEATVYDWLPELTAALTAAGRDRDIALTLATIALAVERGLLLDRSATGDAERVKTAHETLIGFVRAARG